jgi:hypothetical protein
MAKKQKTGHYLYEFFDKDKNLLSSKKSTKKLSEQQIDKKIDELKIKHNCYYFTVRTTKHP